MDNGPMARTPEKKPTWFNMVQPSLNRLCASTFVRAMVLVGGLNPPRPAWLRDTAEDARAADRGVAGR